MTSWCEPCSRRGGSTSRRASPGTSSPSCATRAGARLALGASPRSGIALLSLAKARALVERRDFVVPEDVQALAESVLAHRLILAPEARATGVTAEEVVSEALAATPAPV